MRNLEQKHEEEENDLKKRFKDAMKETQDLYKGEIASAIQTIQDLKLEVSNQAHTIDLQSKQIRDLGQNDAPYTLAIVDRIVTKTPCKYLARNV